MCRLVQSKLFTFYVGTEKRAFVVHSKAIAATSWYFHALVNNGMAQSQEGSVEYPDMDPGDFARYVEYAYRYDYTVPLPGIDRAARSNVINGNAHSCEDAPSPAEPEPEPPLEEEPASVPEPVPEPEPEPVQELETEDWGVPSWAKRKPAKRKPAKRTDALRKRFDERNYLTPLEPKTAMLIDQMPKSNITFEQDFTRIFLAHARLYTFACMRLVDPLKRLTLQKLHQTLRGFKLYKQRVGDVVELARYAYDHGENRKSDGTIDELRKLVVEYIACEVSTIGKHEAFMLLLQEGGEFVADFWRIIADVNLGL